MSLQDAHDAVRLALVHLREVAVTDDHRSAVDGVLTRVEQLPQQLAALPATAYRDHVWLRLLRKWAGDARDLRGGSTAE